MEKQSRKNSNRLVLVLYPFQGHINPMLQLAAIFHGKGYSITILHPEFNSPDPSNHPHFTFISFPDTSSLESKVPLAPGDFMTRAWALNKYCATPLKKCLKRILDQKHPHECISGIIYDSTMYCAQTVADYFGLPGIGIRTVAAVILLLSVIPQPNHESLENPIPELQLLQLKQTMASSFPQNSTDVLLEVSAALSDATNRSSATILNTMEFLEHQALSNIRKCFPAPIFTIGPFHKLASHVSSSLIHEDTNCISWLAKQAPKSVTYVSFGSMVRISEKDIVEIAWGLANSNQPFLWVIRPGLVNGSQQGIDFLPEGFQEKVGEKGCIVKWAPQKQVLAHEAVGLFWTHCGWNSTLESVSEGVPMLCSPCVGDQFLNVKYICHVWKIGLELENELKREKIESAIRKVMVDIEGEEIRKKAFEFKEKTELCLKEGGSSINSLNEFTKWISSVMI